MARIERKFKITKSYKTSSSTPDSRIPNYPSLDKTDISGLINLLKNEGVPVLGGIKRFSNGYCKIYADVNNSDIKGSIELIILSDSSIDKPTVEITLKNFQESDSDEGRAGSLVSHENGLEVDIKYRADYKEGVKKVKKIEERIRDFYKNMSSVR
jgi:hypothetical protein|tara:strand:+ start:4102 stop:4566 length:465 start_codon:yes stop_codon:yes gene_type:complete